MDFNIDNESFAAAYRCLKNANELLEVGLGDFSELNGSALSLVGLDDRKNSARLLNLIYKCGKLKDNMYNTIKYLSMMDESADEFFDDILNEDLINNDDFVDSEYLKYLRGEGTTEEQFRRIIELTQNGSEIKDGATGFQFRGKEIYYDSEYNQFYYRVEIGDPGFKMEIPDNGFWNNDPGFKMEIPDNGFWNNDPGFKMEIPDRLKGNIQVELTPDYLLKNIENITGGNKVQREEGIFDFPIHKIGEENRYEPDIDYLLPIHKIGEEIEKTPSINLPYEVGFGEENRSEPDIDYLK